MAATQQTANPIQVLSRVDPGGGSFDGIGDMDVPPMPERTQLLQTLRILQPARAPGHEVGQEASTVGINADVPPVRDFGR